MLLLKFALSYAHETFRAEEQFTKLCVERGKIATQTTFLLTAPLFPTFLTSNFPDLFVLLNFIL